MFCKYKVYVHVAISNLATEKSCVIIGPIHRWQKFRLVLTGG